MDNDGRDEPEIDVSDGEPGAQPNNHQSDSPNPADANSAGSRDRKEEGRTGKGGSLDAGTTGHLPGRVRARVVAERELIDLLQSFQWSGALPHPRDLEEYNRLIPNAGERFMQVYEAETIAPSKRADQEANAEVRNAAIDRTAALVALGGFVGLSTMFFLIGNNIAGALFLAPPVLGLIRLMWPRQFSRS